MAGICPSTDNIPIQPGDLLIGNTDAPSVLTRLGVGGIGTTLLSNGKQPLWGNPSISIGMPIAGGTPGDILIVDPSGLLGEQPPAALTKTDDTNVTLTLGGTPASALLQATSLTLGWTGTLAILRGGTGQSTANAAFNALAPSQATNSGKFLTTNGTDTSWAAGGGGGMAIGGTVTSGTTGSLLFVGAGPVLAQDNAHAFYDVTNHRLGLGTTSPNEQLELTGNLRLVASTSTVGLIYSGANLLLHTFGTRNTFLGVGAGNLTTTAADNVGVGLGVLAAISTSQLNVAVGSQALASATTGGGHVAIGSQSMQFLTTGALNVAIGLGCLGAAAFNGSGIVAVGASALQSLTTGLDVTAVGHNALSALTTGGRSTAVGKDALLNSVTGSYDTAIGFEALKNTNVAADSNNTAVGRQAGLTNTTGVANTFIGSISDAGANNLTFATAIGCLATVSDSNFVVLGKNDSCVGVGSVRKPSTGTLGLIFGAGTALATMAAGTAGLYAQTTAGVTHLIAIASDGTTIQVI